MTRYLTGQAGRVRGPYELSAAGHSVWAILKSVAQRVRNRRAVMQLLDWDEHALRDIGLTRADIHLSLALPLREDPSTRLMFWSLERRSARLLKNREACRPGEPAHLRLVSGRSRSKSASISR